MHGDKFLDIYVPKMQWTSSAWLINWCYDIFFSIISIAWFLVMWYVKDESHTSLFLGIHISCLPAGTVAEAYSSAFAGQVLISVDISDFIGVTHSTDMVHQAIFFAFHNLISLFCRRHMDKVSLPEFPLMVLSFEFYSSDRLIIRKSKEISWDS